MKNKLLICLAFCLLSLNTFCQENKETNLTASQSVNQHENNELSINFGASIMGHLELNYERFVFDDMGMGLATSISIEKMEDMSRRWYVLPYYRLYFGKKRASGFFVEGNIALVGQKKSQTSYNWNKDTQSNDYSYYTEATTSFGFGGAVGIKLLAKHGFTAQVYLGGGRLLTNSMNRAYPRIGVCIGKIF